MRFEFTYEPDKLTRETHGFKVEFSRPDGARLNVIRERWLLETRRSTRHRTYTQQKRWERGSKEFTDRPPPVPAHMVALVRAEMAMRVQIDFMVARKA